MTSFNRHVLFIPSWYPNKPEDIVGSFFREQAIALAQSNVSVGVLQIETISLRNFRSDFLQKTGLIKYEDHSVRIYKRQIINWFLRFAKLRSKHFIFAGMRAYEAYVKDHSHPDVIHVHSMLYAGALAVAIKKKYGIPFVISEHSSAFAQNRINTSAIKIQQECARNAKFRFAVSEHFADLIESTLGTVSGRWAVMPNFVAEEFLTYPLKEDPTSEFNFIHVSTLLPNKGVKDIIKAFKKAFSTRLDVKLTIVGDGPHKPGLETMVADQNLSRKIEFTGRLTRKNVKEKMAISDALILNSRHETFGVVLIEAMALGKPVISTRCGGPNAIVTPDVGYLINPGDTQALSASMIKLTENRHTFQPTKIRAACRTRFGKSSLLQTWHQIYTAAQLLDQKHD